MVIGIGTDIVEIDRIVGVLSRQLKLPIYLNRSIKKKVSSANSLHEIRTFNSGSTFQINNLAVHPFAVSHDAADPAHLDYLVQL